jgi:acetyl esterase/lipase
VYPQTEHGFDLMLPRYAPAAQTALYEVDRFLALMV